VSEPTMRYRYFEVVARPQKPTRKTRDYDVVTRGGPVIGVIAFYTQWRQHVLAPAPNTVWSAGCLADIQDAIRRIKGA
jgi:hypothetical protein